jgi:Fumble
LEVPGRCCSMVLTAPGPGRYLAGAWQLLRHDLAVCTACSAQADVHSASGRLHFVTFETSRMEEALEFIKTKLLHARPGKQEMLVKATGGGAHK